MTDDCASLFELSIGPFSYEFRH